jgi:hypothetical protein
MVVYQPSLSLKVHTPIRLNAWISLEQDGFNSEFSSSNTMRTSKLPDLQMAARQRHFFHFKSCTEKKKIQKKKKKVQKSLPLVDCG